MGGKSAKEKSIEKVKLLRDPVVSAAFGHYFNRTFQTRRLLEQITRSGADLEKLREWALYSLISLRTDEAEEKQRRGRSAKTQLKKALIGYENAIAFCSQYAAAPGFG